MPLKPLKRVVVVLCKHPDDAERTLSTSDLTNSRQQHPHSKSTCTSLLCTDDFVPCTAAGQATDALPPPAHALNATFHFIPKQPPIVREQTYEELSNEVPLA